MPEVPRVFAHRLLAQSWQPNWAATIVYLCRQDQVLLIHKLRGHGKSMINGPGGKVNPGESPREGAIREVKEEVHVDVHELSLRARIKFSDAVTDFRVDGYIYVSEKFSGTPQPTDEAIPFWCDRDAIPYDRMWNDDRVWLPQVLAGELIEMEGVFENDEFVEYWLSKPKTLNDE